MTTIGVQINDLTSPDASLIDYDTRAGLIARRNVLLGLWAARRLGVAGEDAEAYAWSVHSADLGEPGHDDVVAKVEADFARKGVAVPKKDILRQLREMERRAQVELASEPL